MPNFLNMFPYPIQIQTDSSNLSSLERITGTFKNITTICQTFVKANLFKT